MILYAEGSCSYSRKTTSCLKLAQIRLQKPGAERIYCTQSSIILHSFPALFISFQSHSLVYRCVQFVATLCANRSLASHQPLAFINLCFHQSHCNNRLLIINYNDDTHSSKPNQEIEEGNEVQSSARRRSPPILTPEHPASTRSNA